VLGGSAASFYPPHLRRLLFIQPGAYLGRNQNLDERHARGDNEQPRGEKAQGIVA
jgi:hypothetical protein